MIMHWTLEHLIYAGLSTSSLPFVVYIAFKIGKIAQQFDDLHKRVDILERTIERIKKEGIKCPGSVVS